MAPKGGLDRRLHPAKAFVWRASMDWCRPCGRPCGQRCSRQRGQLLAGAVVGTYNRRAASGAAAAEGEEGEEGEGEPTAERA